MFDITEECMLKRKFNHVVKPVEEITSKDIYWKLLKDIVGAPTCIQSWQTKHGFSFDEEIWKVIFELPYKIAKSVKIREFQLKIIHRVYASKSYVSRFDKSVKNNCITCSTKCDIIHMFYNCDNVKTFWNSFELWFASHCTDIVVTLDIVIFGQTSPRSFLINFCLLYAKWFLHKGYVACGSDKIYVPNFAQFLISLKHTLSIEKDIAFKNEMVADYYKSFSQLELYFTQ